MLLTFEMFGSARNHGKKFLKNVRPPLAVSSIVVHIQFPVKGVFSEDVEPMLVAIMLLNLILKL